MNHAILENYYDRKMPVPARGPIQLQTHGGEIRWRNIFIREIGGEEANKILASQGEDAAFQPAWNGKDFTGWAGPVENYEIVDGAIRCIAGKGGTIYRNEELTDFVARLEFKAPARRQQRPRHSLPRRRATPPTSACASCRCSTTTRRNTRSSIRGRSTAPPTAWPRRSAATSTRPASGTFRK